MARREQDVAALDPNHRSVYSPSSEVRSFEELVGDATDTEY